MKKGKTIWLFGRSGSGKTTLAKEFIKQWKDEQNPIVLLDGDILRASISKDLGFSVFDRMEQNRRAACMAQILNNQGFHVLAALISPTEEIRDAIAHEIGKENIVFIWINCSIETCISRDVKQLYAKEKIQAPDDFQSIQHPFEAPNKQCLSIITEGTEIHDCVAELLAICQQSFQ